MLGIFLDMETNGLNWQRHRGLEIALRVLELPEGDEVGRYEQIIAQPREVWDSSDPTSLKVNGFTWEMVEKGKPEAEVGREVVGLFGRLGVARGKALFFCQNPSFDRAFFGQLVSPDIQEERGWPYHWLDLASMYWAWKGGAYPISKDAIAGELGLPPEAQPHRAMNGVDHLVKCYLELIRRFPSVRRT